MRINNIAVFQMRVILRERRKRKERKIINPMLRK
jgi:hypothetical protein